MIRIILALYHVVTTLAELVRQYAEENIAKLEKQKAAEDKMHHQRMKDADDNFQSSVNLARDIKTRAKESSLKAKQAKQEKILGAQLKKHDALNRLSEIK